VGWRRDRIVKEYSLRVEESIGKNEKAGKKPNGDNLLTANRKR